MTKKARHFGFGSFAAAALCLAAVAAAQVSPTPTPRPRLTGGFGRPRATPAPPSDGGQGLADVVRAAHDSRDQSAEKGSVTINNRSLVTNPDKGRVSTSKVAAPKSAPPPAAAVPATAEAPAAAASTTGGTEAEWRDTMHRLKKRVEDGKARVAELEATNKKLETDFYGWDDGQYRDRVIKPAWDRARNEFEDARRDLAGAEKELADLPEKARRAGALPGWIRE